MSKPNVTRVQSATERTASVHTLHMSKPNVTRVQSATERTASVLLRTAKCYSTTTPVLLCTTKYYSCFALQTKTINQPASQPVWPAGRRTRCWPASRATWKRPAGKTADRPAGSFRPFGKDFQTICLRNCSVLITKYYTVYYSVPQSTTQYYMHSSIPYYAVLLRTT